VTLDDVEVHSAVTDDTAMLKITGLQQRRAGAWRAVTKQHPAQVRAGHTLTVRLVFAGGTTGKRFSLAVPKRAAGMTASIEAFPATSFPFEQSFPHQLSGVRKLVNTMQRNDQAQIFFTASGKRHALRSTALTPAQGTVIDGHTRAKVRIS
jgi:hypothetical protein